MLTRMRLVEREAIEMRTQKRAPKGENRKMIGRGESALVPFETLFD
jgi:hypothetical protein